MSTDLKSETARANGAKSHGPVTPEGKARSAANSQRHGFASSSILLVGESEEDYQLLRAEFMDQFQPQSPVEAGLVELMTIARWRLRRLLAIETHLFDLEIVYRRDEIKSRSRAKAMEQEDRLAYVFQKLGDNGNSLTLLLRYEGSLNRSYDKALKHLLLLQSTRPPEPPLGSFCILEQEPANGIENAHSLPAAQPNAGVRPPFCHQSDDDPLTSTSSAPTHQNLSRAPST